MRIYALAIMAVMAFGGSLAVAGTGTPASAVVLRVEMDRDLVLSNGPQRAVVKITLDAERPPKQQERPPVNLAIVLDRSGSMRGDSIEYAKLAAIEALRRLDERDIFSLVVYDHEVETLIPAQSITNRDDLEARIREIRPRGYTALFAGVSQGAAELRKNLDPQLVHRIILLSDGLANRGPSTPAELGRLGAALMKEGISVTTVGLGLAYNEDLMTRLAQQSDGNTYFVEDSRDLPRIFARELGDVLNVVAKRVVVEFSFQDGVRPVRIIGREGRLSPQGVEISMNQLYGGQEKYVLVEVEIPGGAPNTRLNIGRALCRYEDVFTMTEIEQTKDISAAYTDSPEEVKVSANPEVQREMIRNIVAETKDEVVELFDAGRSDDAISNIRQRSGELRELSRQYNLPADMMREVEMFEVDSQVLQSEGMSPARRKSLRTESMNIRTQQLQE